MVYYNKTSSSAIIVSISSSSSSSSFSALCVGKKKKKNQIKNFVIKLFLFSFFFSFVSKLQMSAVVSYDDALALLLAMFGETYDLDTIKLVLKRILFLTLNDFAFVKLLHVQRHSRCSSRLLTRLFAFLFHIHAFVMYFTR